MPVNKEARAQILVEIALSSLSEIASTVPAGWLIGWRPHCLPWSVGSQLRVLRGPSRDGHFSDFCKWSWNLMDNNYANTMDQSWIKSSHNSLYWEPPRFSWGIWEASDQSWHLFPSLLPLKYHKASHSELETIVIILQEAFLPKFWNAFSLGLGKPPVVLRLQVDGIAGIICANVMTVGPSTTKLLLRSLLWAPHKI